MFPEVPTLGERGLGDGVGNLYQRMAERGELVQAGRRVSDIPALLAEALSRWGKPVAIVADRWREAELRQHLEAIRFPLAELVVRGQGFRDGGEDVRCFRRAVLGDHVRPAASLLLTAALAEARTVSDPAGNAKLAKSSEGGRRQNARDDAAAAALLAVSYGFRRWHVEPERRRPRRTALVGLSPYLRVYLRVVDCSNPNRVSCPRPVGSVMGWSSRLRPPATYRLEPPHDAEATHGTAHVRSPFPLE